MYEKSTDWVISSEVPNRETFNDHPAWEYIASAMEVVDILLDEDMV